MRVVNIRMGRVSDTKYIGSFTGELNHIIVEELQSRNETDHDFNMHSFGNMRRALFLPSPFLRTQMSTVMQNVGLLPCRYQAVHVRTRHPGRIGSTVTNLDGQDVNVVGSGFQERNWEEAIQDGVLALQCAYKASDSASNPAYFHFDLDDLVRYFQSFLRDGNASMNISGSPIFNGGKDNININHSGPMHTTAYTGDWGHHQ
jgi:hypothetical protein